MIYIFTDDYDILQRVKLGKADDVDARLRSHRTSNLYGVRELVRLNGGYPEESQLKFAWREEAVGDPSVGDEIYWLRNVVRQDVDFMIRHGKMPDIGCRVGVFMDHDGKQLSFLDTDQWNVRWLAEAAISMRGGVDSWPYTREFEMYCEAYRHENTSSASNARIFQKVNRMFKRGVAGMEVVYGMIKHLPLRDKFALVPIENRPLLESLYVEAGVAVDNLPYTSEIDAIVASFNTATGMQVSAGEVFRTLLRIRKGSELERLVR